MQINQFGNDICKSRASKNITAKEQNLEGLFFGWIASLVVSRCKYMCVLNQHTINEQRNNNRLFVDL